ncbi:hypothetical protein CLM85_14430 [Streptomyces albidoflavus]|nr:hypothetical protein CLM85_14430 [Streptomyces albidoflavus]
MTVCAAGRPGSVQVSTSPPTDFTTCPSAWLPGADVLRWACVRAARSTRPVSVFPPVRPGAKVYDVSRRR